MAANDDNKTPGFWQRLDARIYAFESVLVIAATAIMTGMVFSAVVWRIFAAPHGKVARVLAQVFAREPAEMATVADSISLSVWMLLCVFAVRTARRDWGWRNAVLVGGAAALGTTLLAKLFVWMVPGGIVFSQRVALCLLLWVVLLGSSMAAHTRRHIFLQAAQKLVPDNLLKLHAGVGLLAAAMFTLFLTYVSAVYAANNVDSWIASDMRAGVFESIAIPYWTVTISIPLGFFMTTARFTGQAIGIWRGIVPPVPPSEEIEAAERSAESSEIPSDADLDAGVDP